MPPKRTAGKVPVGSEDAAGKVGGRGKKAGDVKPEVKVKDENGQDPPEEPATTDGDAKRKRAKPTPKQETPAADADDDASDVVPKPAKKPRASKSNPKPDPFHPSALSTHPARIGTTTQIPMRHIIGAHTSTSGGPEFALLNASELGANALAMFLKNQRRWESKGFEEASLGCWKRMMKTREEGGESRVASSRRHVGS